MLTVTSEGKTLKPNGLILGTLSNVKPWYSQYLKVPQRTKGYTGISIVIRKPTSSVFLGSILKTYLPKTVS